MLFPVLKTESIVQVNDQTRLDATSSYITPDEAALTVIEIEPESGAGFFDVLNLKYLDWQYATDGDKTVTVRIDNGTGAVTSTQTITVLTEADDRLFSIDRDILAFERNVLKYVKAGRNSHLDLHREAQKAILDDLDKNRVWDSNGERLEKEQIYDIREVNDWSKFWVLAQVFEDQSNSPDDIFAQKSDLYRSKARSAKSAAAVRLDLDKDGEKDVTVDLFSVTLRRR